MHDGNYDAIVVGSGIGGMAAAGMLARLRNMRVLVLERHTELGGQTHEFRRESFSWDVGLHYVGQMNEGSLTRRFMDFISGGKVKWNRLPENFERFAYPGISLEVPSNSAEYRKKLTDLFPGEAKAIRRYFHDVRAIANWHVRDFVSHCAPWYVRAALSAVNLFGRAMAIQSTESYLNRNFKDPALCALLASQWGDYGLPPRESAFAIHALIVTHYLEGAWFPQGGAGRIAAHIETTIEASGGQCLLGYEVTRILTEFGRVSGVEAREKFGASRKVFHAPIVISDIGIRETCERLLGNWPDRRTREKVAALGKGYSAVTLYLGLSETPEALGVKGENLWIYENGDHNDIEGMSHDLCAGRPRHAYISFPSLKKGGAGTGSLVENEKHTMEIISHVSTEAFAAWSASGPENRGPEYRELKNQISQGLLALAEKHLPGLGALVVYAELSTPLSIEHYTGHAGGAFYGLPARPRRYRQGGFSPKTAIRGLYFSGSDVSSLGISGAMMGGIAAASCAMGRGGFMATFAGRLSADQRRAPNSRAAQDHQKMTNHRGPSGNDPAIPVQRFSARVSLKSEIRPSVFEIRLQSAAFPASVPGQFAKVRVGETEWREYSIVTNDESGLVFVISAKTKGLGSAFVRNLAEGDSVDLRMPFGSFTVAPEARRKVFVATGTGIAPVAAQIGELARTGFSEKVEVFFGCPKRADDLSSRYLDKAADSLNMIVRVCTSREADGDGRFFGGRVDAALRDLDFDPQATEFYLAGNPRMVEDVTRMLDAQGAVHVKTERY